MSKANISTKTEILVPYETFISNPVLYGPTGYYTPWRSERNKDHHRFGNPRMYVFDLQKKKWIIYDEAGHVAGTTGILINGWAVGVDDKDNKIFIRKTAVIDDGKKSKSLLDYIPYAVGAVIAAPLMALGYRRATRSSVARARRRRSRRRSRKRRSRRSSRKRY